MFDIYIFMWEEQNLRWTSWAEPDMQFFSVGSVLFLLPVLGRLQQDLQNLQDLQDSWRTLWPGWVDLPAVSSFGSTGRWQLTGRAFQLLVPAQHPASSSRLLSFPPLLSPWQLAVCPVLRSMQQNTEYKDENCSQTALKLFCFVLCRVWYAW